MGLDTSHDCWHGPYSSFHNFRTSLAKTVGITLSAMTGFGGDLPFPSRDAEPLVILLDHSDCEGEIAASDCEPLAKRLEEILPQLGDADAHFSDAWYAQRFVAGLKKAAAAGEPVEFH